MRLLLISCCLVARATAAAMPVPAAVGQPGVQMCGTDYIPDSRRKRHFSFQGLRWRSKSVTWSLNESSSSSSSSSGTRRRSSFWTYARAEVTKAFDVWSRATGYVFTELAAESRHVDIDISFRSGDHGDGSAFDGPGGIMAHAFYPGDFDDAIDGDIHLDGDEDWTTDEHLLFNVLLHEIGHSLGLGHDRNHPRESLMYPFYVGDVVDYTNPVLPTIDLHALLEDGSGSKTTATTPTTTTAAAAATTTTTDTKSRAKLTTTVFGRCGWPMYLKTTDTTGSREDRALGTSGEDVTESCVRNCTCEVRPTGYVYVTGQIYVFTNDRGEYWVHLLQHQSLYGPYRWPNMDVAGGVTVLTGVLFSNRYHLFTSDGVAMVFDSSRRLLDERIMHVVVECALVLGKRIYVSVNGFYHTYDPTEMRVDVYTTHTIRHSDDISYDKRSFDAVFEFKNSMYGITDLVYAPIELFPVAVPKSYVITREVEKKHVFNCKITEKSALSPHCRSGSSRRRGRTYHEERSTSAGVLRRSLSLIFVCVINVVIISLYSNL